MLDQKQFTLKQLRMLAGLSQEELGKAIGVTSRTIGAYEADVEKLKNISYHRLMSIADVLDVSVDDIFLGDTSD